MKSLLLILFLACQAAWATVSMEESAEMVVEDLEKRQSGFIITRGIAGTTGARREIRDLARDADRWNLYLIGMQRFQSKNQNDPLGYFSIAAIHGRPYRPYNNSPSKRGNANGGYCPHISNMFATWHTPYLAHFEYAWYQSVREVVAEFPAAQRARWQRAADGLRMPYFDWARTPPAGQCTVPTLIRDQRVNVITPRGAQNIANPIYSYFFHPSSDLPGAPFNYWPQTWRRPIPPDRNARSNNNDFCTNMNNNRQSLRVRVYNLFARETDYMRMATECNGNNCGNNSPHDSLESIHDVTHILAGDGSPGGTDGHMYFLDYSSFDPLFWLHHTNIDRIHSMWMVANPRAFVRPGATTMDNWQWYRGEVKDANSPLPPFRRDAQGNYFTSNGVRSSFTFNYFYPETPRGADPNTIRRDVINLYGPNARSTFKRDSHVTDSLSADYQGHAPAKGDRDYDAYITCDKFALDTSYAVYFFLGDGKYTNGTSTNGTAGYNPEDASSWDTAPNLCGVHGVLAPYGKKDHKVISTGTVPLTTKLQGLREAGVLPNLDEDTVTAYLKENLHWAYKQSGRKVDAEQLVDLQVSVVSAEITSVPSSDDEFPTYGPPKVHPECTEGKPNGYDGGDDYTPPKHYGVPSHGGDDGGDYEQPEYPGHPDHPEYPGHPGGEEDGHCPSDDTTYEYVDEQGNFLYSDFGSS